MLVIRLACDMALFLIYINANFIWLIRRVFMWGCLPISLINNALLLSLLAAGELYLQSIVFFAFFI